MDRFWTLVQRGDTFYVTEHPPSTPPSECPDGFAKALVMA